LDASGVSDLGPSGVATHVNKVHQVTTVTGVAEQLGEDENWLRDVASEMEIEDDVLWVYGVDESSLGRGKASSGSELKIEDPHRFILERCCPI
jgi:hypothetical protein